MIEIRCSGSPREIGHAHGSGARAQVHGSIAFYSKLFQERCAMAWDDVTREASRYVAPLRAACPRYLEELEGLAAGAGVPFLSVLALNVRTEIAFGLYTTSPPQGAAQGQQEYLASDGCTSLALRAPSSSSSSSSSSSGRSFLAQNWDWQPAQAANLIVCHVSAAASPSLTSISNSTSTSPSPDMDVDVDRPPPDLVMVTEAGIIGKIGFNAAGVGCCLNAICARGVDPTRLPVHLALRHILESPSRAAAVARLRKLGGVAGSAHILVADAGSGAAGLECTPGGAAECGIRELAMDARGRVVHTNHLVLAHGPGVEENMWLADSPARLARMEKLSGDLVVAQDGGEVDFGGLMELFKDEEGYPHSINRKADGKAGSETLFTIIMDLTERKGLVKFGRPTEDGEQITLVP